MRLGGSWYTRALPGEASLSPWYQRAPRIGKSVRGGPSRLGESDEAPLQATFLVLGAGREVAQFKSDAKGRFEILLPAGDYVIVPDRSAPMPAPQHQTKPVTVPEEGFAVVTLRFDTGMR